MAQQYLAYINQIHDSPMQKTYSQKLNSISKQKRTKWQNQQQKIKTMIKEFDQLPCLFNKINLIAGVDISFSNKFNNGACAGLIIYNMEKKNIVYEDFQFVVLLEEYIPGFLAFRQLGPTVQLFNRLKKQRPDLWPDVIMVDGNGILHKRQCGYASHLGVLLNTPSFGCSKKFFDMDGLYQSQVQQNLNKCLKKYKQYQIIKGKSGRIWCAGILVDVDENKYVFVSVGTKIRLQSAILLTLNLLKYQSPQPIRLADKISRKWIRTMSQENYKKAKSYNMVFL